MSISLNATLQSAQDSADHYPIVEIISSPVGEIVPTLGNYFNTLTTDEWSPELKALSSGRMACLMIRGSLLYYLYTDTARSQWYEQSIAVGAGGAISASLCELTNGNVGIIFVNAYDQLCYVIISETGTIVTAKTVISTGTWYGNPYVITLANNTYLMVYPEGTGTPPDDTKTYYLKQRTSSNFTSWSSATDITPAAFASNRYCDNPHLVQLTTGRIYIHLDYLTIFQSSIEVNNIYHMISDDNGSSWTNAVNITNYTELGDKATHPCAIEKSNGDLLYIFTDGMSVKQLTNTMDGYPAGEGFTPKTIHFDPNTRLLYVFCESTYYNVFQNLVVIDVDSWSYVKRYNLTTLPAFQETPSASKVRSEGKWCVYFGTNIIMSLNTETDVIKWYRCNTIGGVYNPNFFITQECQYSTKVLPRDCVVVGDILYIHAYCDKFSTWEIFGWIDLNETADPITGYYTWHEVLALSNYTGNYFRGNCRTMRWISELGYILVCTGDDSEHPYNLGIFALNPTTGAIVWNVTGTTVPQFPIRGAWDAVYKNGYIWFVFLYDSSESAKRGLGRYNPNDNSILYFEPNWFTTTEYGLRGLEDMGDDRICMTVAHNFPNGGIAIFDTVTHTWTNFNDQNYPGMLLPNDLGANWGVAGYFIRNLAYDSVAETIYAAYSGYYGVDSPVLIALSEYGAYSLLEYGDVSSPNATPSYGSTVKFAYEDFESQAIIAYDPDYILWGVWRHLENGTEYSVKWAVLLEDLDLSDDLSLEDAIKIEWEIKKINKIEFTLARGYLYDPQNLLSVISGFVRKGRKFVVRVGEQVGGQNYWQAQGEFLSSELSLVYEVNKYPKLKVIGYDLRVLWKNKEIVATSYYSGETAQNTLDNLLLYHGELAASEYDISGFAGHDVYHQWTAEAFDDIIEMMMDHFKFFGRVSVDGKFIPKYVDFSAAVNHAYGTSDKFVQFTPDESYSSFVNRIIVKGLSHNLTEVLYPEESITSISGTTGWWGRRTDETVWYSEDHNRTCRNPRLEIIQSVSEFQGFLDAFASSGGEYISGVDTAEHYVIITIEAPNLMGAFIGAVIALVACGAWAIGCDGLMSGWCGVAIYACTVATSVVLNILGAVASYSYNIWAWPIGFEKQSFQDHSDDEDLQKELGGRIIQEIIEDPLCYTIGSCKTVADYEMSITMAQRRKIKTKKPMHLKDEIGDIITFAHPYSGESIKMYLTSIKRKIIIGKSCIDDIEGWRLLT